MRIFKDCLEMIKEIDRELLVCGITVPVKHYQNQKLEGDDQITKELVGVSFTITKERNRKEMLEFAFKEDADRIEKYCQQEHADRTCGKALNPGNSYKIRQDMWQKFMVDNESKFDYTYSERMSWQLENVIQTLVDDIHSRQAYISVFQPEIDNERFGGDSRIPCSLGYQIMIRNNRLNVIYMMRSNDYFGHMPIDIWLAWELGIYLVDRLQETYPRLKLGHLTYFSGSLHAYNWDLKKQVVF